MRVSGSYELFPIHCQLPTLSPIEHTEQVAHELVRCLEHLPRTARQRLLTTMLTTLRRHTSMPLTFKPAHDITTIPWNAADNTPPVHSKGAPFSKGAPITIPTSTNPTARHIVRTAPHIHGRHTRVNTPPPTHTQPVPLSTTPPVINIPGTPTTTVNTIELRRSPRIALLSPRHYSQTALTAIAAPPPAQPTTSNYNYCAPVTHPITGETITNYKKLIADPLTATTWAQAFGKEFGNLAQGDAKTNTPGTDSIHVLPLNQLQHIPKDRTITYARIVVDYRPQKQDPNRVRITAGGNLITYPGELTTRTADLTTTKILWNSVISTPHARYLCLDIKNFYLGTPMDRFEYMKMPLDIFPPHTRAQYELDKHAKNGFIYL